MPANPLAGNYDPKKLVVTFGGVPLGGYGDSTFVEIAPNNADGVHKKIGADGEVSRSFDADNTHQVTVTLMQSSDSNAYLSGVRNADKLTGHSILPLSITDLSGGSMGFWPQAWIRGDPTWGYGKEDQERQWIIDTGQQAEDNKAGMYR
jgi:hypothetical protein